jgi:hypothetical protein
MGRILCEISYKGGGNSMSDMLGQLKHLLDLHDRKSTLQEELKSVGAEIESLQQPLTDWFTDQGIQKQTINGRTAYLRRDIFAGLNPEGKTAAMDALSDDEDTAFLVGPSVNAQRLSSYIRELPRDESGAVVLPEKLRPHIVVRDKYTIGVRAS